MIEPFYLAAIPEPRTILGLRLKPLSLGHLILLNRIESPFVVGGQVEFSDLATAVLICSLTFKEGVQILDDPDLDEFMLKWHDRAAGNDRWVVRLGFISPNVVNFPEKFAAFLEWFEEHNKKPFYRYDATQFSEMDCPYVQAVKVTLMRDLHIPEAELMDRSWSLCQWDFITLKAQAGHIQMGQEDDIKSALELANRLQARINSRNGGTHANS